MTTISVLIGFADGVRDKGSDNFGESADDETDEGVKNHLLGFLEFAGVALGGDITDTAINYENSGGNTGHSDGPLNEIGDHLAWIYTAPTIGTVADIATTADEGNSDGAHDDIGGHNDGKADESLS